MLTVTIKTKQGQTTVAEETLECTEVRLVTTGWRGLDGKPDEHPGVYIYFDRNTENHKHVGSRNDGLWYDFFVMNEAGKTVNRFPL